MILPSCSLKKYVSRGVGNASYISSHDFNSVFLFGQRVFPAPPFKSALPLWEKPTETTQTCSQRPRTRHPLDPCLLLFDDLV